MAAPSNRRVTRAMRAKIERDMFSRQEAARSALETCVASGASGGKKPRSRQLLGVKKPPPTGKTQAHELRNRRGHEKRLHCETTSSEVASEPASAPEMVSVVVQETMSMLMGGAVAENERLPLPTPSSRETSASSDNELDAALAFASDAQTVPASQAVTPSSLASQGVHARVRLRVGSDDEDRSAEEIAAKGSEAGGESNEGVEDAGSEAGGHGDEEVDAEAKDKNECLDSDMDGDSSENEFFEAEGVPQLHADLGMEVESDEEEVNRDDELFALSQNQMAVRDMKGNGWDYGVAQDHPDRIEYPGLYKGRSGPIEAVASRAESPLALFFFFLPKTFWRLVSLESNRYYGQKVADRAVEIQKRQKAQHRKDAEQPVQMRKEIREELREMPRIEPHEIVHTLGLMVARMLCPHKRRLGNHWGNGKRGAVPGGSFGEFMTRNRFDQVMGALHFADNEDPNAKHGRAWKIRPVVTCLQHTFRKGYVCPGVLSIDEGMLPSRLPYNGTRVYMKDKAHKWGTKLFLTCDAETAYCLRLEVCCGVKQHLSQGPQTVDAKSGPSAVLRNMDAVVPRGRSQHHLVVIDRFYSSIPLSIELLSRNIYTVGAIMTSRIGYVEKVIDKRKTKPKGVGKGGIILARSKKVPEMLALSWMDSKPVHFLATGASSKPDSVQRRLSRSEVQRVPCPKLVKDYHRWMGSVDVHDQLRLQRFSLQLSFVFKKYYKALYLGLVDTALGNVFLVHKITRMKQHKKPMKRGEFLMVLQEQLLQVTADDMTAHEDDTTPPTPSPRVSRRRKTTEEAEHTPKECPDKFKTGAGEMKRRQRACKVCPRIAKALARKGEPVKRGKNTKWYCGACSNGDRRFYLCNIVRGEGPYPSLTCFQVYHEDWDCGRDIPLEYQAVKTQMRAPGGERKRKRRADDDGGHSSEDDGVEQV